MPPISPTFRVKYPFDPIVWPEQLERICKIIESEFPDNPVNSAIIFQGAKAVKCHIEDRVIFFRQRSKTKLRRFTLNNHLTCVAAQGVIGPKYLGQMGIGGTLEADGNYNLMVMMPPNQSKSTYQRAELSICAVLASEAYWHSKA